jgi:phosphopentomutase
VGALPDAADYGDADTNTLAHVAELAGGLHLPTLAALGLARVCAARGLADGGDGATYGRLHPLGPGKDSITGHWELMGVTLPAPLPTYPEGFPDEVLARLTAATGHQLICNRADDGLTAIAEFGGEHLRTGALILYTSQDSVLQLAAHEERVAAAELYRACERARATMSGEHAVGRVIARPFRGVAGAFERTPGRRDYALAPSGRSYLEELRDAGVEVHGVGKIHDLFAGVGLTHAHPGASNEQALASTADAIAGLRHGLVFVNLIETDQVYGHRKDALGFARALTAIDDWLGQTLPALRRGDLLVVTADHGVDPAHPGTDHTREYAPLLASTGAQLEDARGGTSGPGCRHDGPLADVGASVLAWLTGCDAPALAGDAFLRSPAR